MTMIIDATALLKVDDPSTGYNIEPNAPIEVRDPDGNLAIIYSDEDLTVPISQPASCDANGQFLCYVDDGFYNVTISYSSGNVTRPVSAKTQDIRYRTLSQAVSENAQNGTRYIITDLGGARYDVVLASDSGGYYKTGLSSGRKLKLIFDDYAHLDWFGTDYKSGLECGASLIDLPASFTLTQNINLPANTSLRRLGDQCVIDATALSNNAIEQKGSVRATLTLSGNLSDYVSDITLTDASQVNVGDVLRIYSTLANSWSGTWGAANRDYRTQNMRVVTAKSGNTVSLDEPLNVPFLAASTNVDVLDTTTAQHENFKIKLSDSNNSRGLRIEYGYKNTLNKVDTEGGDILGVEFAFCLNTLHANANSELTKVAVNTQYTVAVSSSKNTLIWNCNLRSTRHAVAIVGGYQCENTKVWHSELFGSFPADAHGNADGYEYYDCGIHGDNGIKIGGKDGAWRKCRVTSKNATIIAAIEIYGGTFFVGDGTTIISESTALFGSGWSPIDLGRGTASISSDSRADMTFIFDGLNINLPNVGSYFIRAQNTSNYKMNFRFDNFDVFYPNLSGGFLRYEGTPAGGDSDFIHFTDKVTMRSNGAFSWVEKGSGASGYDTAEVLIPQKKFIKVSEAGDKLILGSYGKIESKTASPYDTIFGVTGTGSSAGRVKIQAEARYGDIRFNIGFDGSAQPSRDVWEFATNGSFRPVTDNVFTIGDATFRPSEIFAVNGTINTSDERLKTPIESISEKEKACALELKQSYGKFKWLESIERESNGGKKARIHFGVGAQTVGEIFRKHGLNPEDYSVFCYDEWDDIIDRRLVTVDGEEVLEEFVRTPAGDLYGVRLEQLNAFIISAI